MNADAFLRIDQQTGTAFSVVVCRCVGGSVGVVERCCVCGSRAEAEAEAAEVARLRYLRLGD